jgi:phosphatidylserine/phosphatidylglycerophosphate/cardiolipin synthase-like enzyme
VSARRKVDLQLIQGRAHYDELVQRAIARARVSIWIGTANVKELRVEAPIGSRARARGQYVSVLELFEGLTRSGVEIRVLHGGLPSGPFRAELERRPGLAADRRFTMRRCPRVHLKMIAVDGALLYLGSANFTGAGLGAKGDRRRNFEAGILTDDDVMLDQMQGSFERIWSGRECSGCAVRALCPAPLDGPVPVTSKAAAPRKPVSSSKTAAPAERVKRALPSRASTVKRPAR